MRPVRRDPFARGAFECTCHKGGQCDWCGQERKRLFSYVWVGDDESRPSIFNAQRGKRQFCKFECFKDYFG